jgi:branched-chain amino acid transport system substrate-binding protein
MRNIYKLAVAALASISLGAPSAVGANEPVRIGFIGEMTGQYADFGDQMLTGMKVYMQEHGEIVAGRKIELVVRDVGGPNPELARRLAQELVTREKVSFLAGFGFSPNALSAARIATQAKVPMIVMNAAAKQIPQQSPYIVRTSMSTAHTAAGTAIWAIKSGMTTAYTMVSDYAPGHDAEESFVQEFERLGGTIVGTLRVSLASVEFGPFMQRVKEAKPDALFSFIAAGNPGAAFFRAVKERELEQAGIRTIGTGDIVYEPVLDVVGDNALGIVTVYPYSAADRSEKNQKFVKEFVAENSSGMIPTIMGVGGYDGMAAIYQAIKQLKGEITSDGVMEALRGMVIESPRGRIVIDRETRDVVQGLYARKVERVDGRLLSVPFEQVTPSP